MKVSNILLVLFAFFVYSSSGIFTKMAGGHDFLSLGYLACLAAAIAVLGLYAVLWQKILSTVPLHLAFSFKSVGVIYAMAFSVFIFGETLTLNNILGILLILCGLLLLTWKKGFSPS